MESVISRFAPSVWLLLSPVSVSIVFGMALILFVTLKRYLSTGKCLLRGVSAILVLSGCLTIFNLFDYWHFRKYGCQTLSPINREWFYVCFPPNDLNVPYCRVLLGEDQSEYKMQFRHKYLGDHVVALNVVNNTPKPFDYDNPDQIGLKFSAGVNTIVKPCQTLAFGEKSYEGYFLHRGTNVLEIISYDFQAAELLGKEHVASVRVRGGLRRFLRTYPGSYISIRNSMHK